MLQPSLVFKSFIAQVSKCKPRPYYSSNSTTQSSVGLIFKIHSDRALKTAASVGEAELHSIELLFTQRAGYQTDSNKYNVVFPGGKCDNTESDYQACMRELKEEIDLEVQDECYYLGQLPRNFFYMRKKGKKIHISCHVWVLKPEGNWQPKLNPTELRQYRWVPFEELLHPDNYILTTELKELTLNRVPYIHSPLGKAMRQKVQGFTMAELKLGMDRNLWGLTLWIWHYFLDMSKQSLSRPHQEHVNALMGRINVLQIVFQPGFTFAVPVQGALTLWNKYYRVWPFTYSNRIVHISVLIFSVILLVVLIMFLF